MIVFEGKKNARNCFRASFENQFRRGPKLAGVKFDDELLVHEWINVGALWNAGNHSFQLILVHIEPIDTRGCLSEVGHAKNQLLR